MHHHVSKSHQGSVFKTDPETAKGRQAIFTDLASEGWVVPDPPSIPGFTAERKRSVGLQVTTTTPVPSALIRLNTSHKLNPNASTGNVIHSSRHLLRCQPAANGTVRPMLGNNFPGKHQYISDGDFPGTGICSWRREGQITANCRRLLALLPGKTDVFIFNGPSWCSFAKQRRNNPARNQGRVA